MKHSCVVMIVSSLFLMACHDQVTEQCWEQSFEMENSSVEIVYPLSKSYKGGIIRTRGGVADFETDWESQQEIITASGLTYPTPWLSGQGIQIYRRVLLLI